MQGPGRQTQHPPAKGSPSTDKGTEAAGPDCIVTALTGRTTITLPALLPAFLLASSVISSPTPPPSSPHPPSSVGPSNPYHPSRSSLPTVRFAAALPSAWRVLQGHAEVLMQTWPTQ